MNDIEAAMAAGVDTLIGATPCSFVHSGHSYTAAVSLTRTSRLDMLNAGYDPTEVDCQVILRASDIIGTGPAERDLVVVNGGAYQVAGEIARNSVFWTIPLRKSV